MLLPQEKLGQGQYNTATTRVLHMVHNPALEAGRLADRAQLAELQSANTALKATLQSLQAAAGDNSTSGDAAAVHSRAVTDAELAVAQQKVPHSGQWTLRQQHVCRSASFQHQRRLPDMYASLQSAACQITAPDPQQHLC